MLDAWKGRAPSGRRRLSGRRTHGQNPPSLDMELRPLLRASHPEYLPRIHPVPMAWARRPGRTCGGPRQVRSIRRRRGVSAAPAPPPPIGGKVGIDFRQPDR